MIENVSKIYIGNTEISKVYAGTVQIYPNSGPTPIDYKTKHFTLEILSAGTVVWKSVSNDVTLEYSIDDGSTWSSITSTAEGVEISVSVGNKVLFRGDNTGTGLNANSYSTFDGSTAVFNAYGNVMSLLNSTGFTTAETISQTFAFRRIFYQTSIVSAEHLILPAKILATNCYSGFFGSCTGLTQAPELPATTLASYCYNYMFDGCSSLQTAPELPATTLTSGCYNGMFQNCSSLNYIKCLADGDCDGYCNNWVLNVAPTGTFVRSINSYWSTGNAGIPTGWVEQTQGEIDYSKRYLTIKVSSDGNLRWYCSTNNTAAYKTIYYSKNNGNTWTNIKSSSGSSAPTFSVNSGDTVLLRGSNNSYSGNSANNFNSFSGSTAAFEVEGNILSMIYGKNYTKYTDLPTDTTHNFNSFFRATKCTSAENLVLANNNQNSYYYMFQNCTGLTKVPDLPQTTLAESCYAHMFRDCKSLTGVSADYLPATTLVKGCYQGMFYQCYSLASVPNLPATTLAESCYTSMFQGCSGLTSVPSNYLPITTLEKSCYQSMFKACKSITNVPNLPATTLAQSCYNQLFYQCSSLQTAPDLLAPTLEAQCYYQMFYQCANLNYIKCLATNISASSCVTGWVNGVAASGTFVKDSSMTNWTTGNNGIPSGWTVQDA